MRNFYLDSSSNGNLVQNLEPEKKTFKVSVRQTIMMLAELNFNASSLRILFHFNYIYIIMLGIFAIEFFRFMTYEITHDISWVLSHAALHKLIILKYASS